MVFTAGIRAIGETSGQYFDGDRALQIGTELPGYNMCACAVDPAAYTAPVSPLSAHAIERGCADLGVNNEREPIEELSRMHNCTGAEELRFPKRRFSRSLS